MSASPIQRGQAFDLAALIRLILVETNLSDPADVAREAMARIPPDAHMSVLEFIMPAYVRARIVAERTLTTPPGAAARLTRSSKVTGIAEWWRGAIEDRVFTSNGYKRLADCTRDDLDYLARKLRQTADSMILKAQRYEKLRDQMDADRPDATVGELPKEVLQGILGTLPNGSTSVEDAGDMDDEEL